jgi:ATPase subunit of ABC transporter with duplicated ATPase domains
LQALPGGVSAEVRRQIVEASLTTFGVATERITEAAHKETEALERFIASNQQATNRGQEEARARVQALEQEIFRVRQAADQAAAAHEMRIRAANNEMVGVNQVLSFFGGAAVVVTDVELDEPTEDRSDWTALPVSPPSRSAKEKVSRPPPIRPREPSGSTPPAPAPASDPSGRTPSS